MPPTGPVEGQTSTAPQDLSCVSDSFCAAVGGFALDVTSNSGGQTALVESWNGQAWAEPQEPVLLSTHPGQVLLSSVSCVTSTFCMAVGGQQTGAQFQGLAVTWDGSRWMPVPILSVDGSANLQSVSCASITYCFAVGVSDPPGSTGQARIVADAWNGSSWSTEPAPLPFGHDLSPSLSTLTCMAPLQCLAAWSSKAPESHSPPGAGFASVSELWSGGSWKRVPIANPEPGSGEFNVISAQSARPRFDCTLVGSTTGTTAEGVDQSSLIETWDGTQWTSTATPAVGLTSTTVP